MPSLTIIHGDIGVGKTAIANAMAKAYPNMKVHEVSSMSEVRGVFAIDKSQDHHIFVCSHNFHFGAHDLAATLGIPYNHVSLYNIYVTRHG